jgi:hypothetical protein
VSIPLFDDYFLTDFDVAFLREADILERNELVVKFP